MFFLKFANTQVCSKSECWK